MDIKLFISAVSVEFELFREPLRHALTRPNVTVKIQEDFKAGGVPTLIKIDDYLKSCDAVVHLVGDACGDDAPPQSVQALFERYPDLPMRVPSLAAHIGLGGRPLTYTQWESWLALYHGKRLFIAKSESATPRGPRYARNDEHAARQLQHLKSLREHKAYPEIAFDSVDSLNAQLLASPILDLLIDAALSTRHRHTEAAWDEFLRQERRAGLPVPFFRYLWQELGSLPNLLGKLADAARNDAVEALATTMASEVGEAPEADLLRDAWRRVQLVRTWEPLVEAMALPISRWYDLASIVADTDARQAPRFVSLRELLLWTLDVSERSRGRAALVQLLWLATEAAKEHGGPVDRAAADSLVVAIEADNELNRHLAKAQAGPRPPNGPVRLFVELDLPPEGMQPLLRRYWVQRERSLEPGPPPPTDTTLGQQLQSLASAIKCDAGRNLQVELLAPLLLLCAEREWTSYREDFGDFAGLGGTLVERDFSEEWPVTWRWRDRLEKHPKSKADSWRQRAPQVIAKANHCAQLVCRFENEPVTGQGAHLLGLHYVPPGPKNKQRNLKAFLDALGVGEPYMLWPSDESMACDDFKAAVRQCIARSHISQLPEVIRHARKAGQLRHAVLLIDEPSRNPYELMGRLGALDAPLS